MDYIGEPELVDDSDSDYEDEEEGDSTQATETGQDGAGVDEAHRHV
jgi:hypothetical protein